MDFELEKKLVLNFYRSLDARKNCLETLKTFTTENWMWRGFHPFNICNGPTEVYEKFWKPFKIAFTSLQRRQDILFAGRNQMDNFQSTWVVSMGHLVGLFDEPFLKIPPTQKMAFFRYCEFHKVASGKIVETAFYFDLPHLMMQAGLNVFPNQRGAQLVQPGPITHNGVLTNPQPTEESHRTLALMNAMIGDLGQWDMPMTLTQELRRTWHEDMIWWGPTGIGASYTIERYAKQHSKPFRAAFTERSPTQHLARLAEGAYGGFFGWPNFTAKLKAPFLGIEPSGVQSEFRVIDIYRRKGDKLSENWVFIDLPHWLLQHGRDILHSM